VWIVPHAAVVPAPRSQVSNQGGEALDGKALGSEKGCFLFPCRAGWCGRPHGMSPLPRFGELLIIKEERRQGLSHVPHQIVGEEAEKDVSSHVILRSEPDGTDEKIEPLQGPEGLFHLRKAFVAPDRVVSGKTVGRLARPDDVEAIQNFLPSDRCLLPGKGEASLPCPNYQIVS